MNSILAITRKPLQLGVCLLLLLPLVGSPQQGTLSCGQLKQGTFYMYPRNSESAYEVHFNGDQILQKSMKTADSAIWRLNWPSDCEYEARLLKTNQKMSPEEKDYFLNHSIFYEVVTVNDDYFLFKVHREKKNGVVVAIDTMWFKPKTNFVSNKIVEYLKQPGILNKEHFGDTSKYAVLYVYRLKKFVGSTATADLWLNEISLCSLTNNSGFAFKIFKEGEITIAGRDKTGPIREQKINIEFGKKYYLKIHFIPKVDTYYAAIGFDLNTKEAALDFETVSYEK
jgi:hypothetical protein